MPALSDMARPRPRFCWLARFASTPCDGGLVRCHLLPRQLLRRELKSRWRAVAADERSWVFGCGGPMGNGGHHGELDQARTLRVPREALPPGLVELAGELGLTWWIDHEYDKGAT
jgi:hypothetical protein